MTAITVHTEGKKLDALMSVLEALEIAYTVEYDKAETLKERIEQARKEKEEGSIKIIEVDNLWESIA